MYYRFQIPIYVYTKNIVINSVIKSRYVRYEILFSTQELLSQVLFSVMQPLPGQPEDDDKEDMVEYYLSGVSILLVFLVMMVVLFSLPQLFSSYSNNILPYIVPTVLPCTSVAMTGQCVCVSMVC